MGERNLTKGLRLAVEERREVAIIVIELANSLNRFRSLTNVESEWLEAAIRREQRVHNGKREFWTKSEDRRLQRYLSRGRKVREIAPLMNKSEGAIWSRLRVLRGTNGHRCKARQGLVAEQRVEALSSEPVIQTRENHGGR